ncbi:MAG: ABC transporter permease [Actinomycetota bacterium]
MGVLREAFDLMTDPASWRGSGSIAHRLFEHVQMSVLATVLAIAVALPLALYVGHVRRGGNAVVSVGNLGRALPSFGVLAIVFPFTLRYDFPGGIGFSATLIALLLLAIPPILTNTYVGIAGVDRDTLEAARGMGMSERQVLTRLELPLAVPLILAGVRTAAVAVVATATLAALVGWGGLGRLIVDGFAAGDDPQLVTGALLVATLAVVTELGLAILERALTPRTTSTAGSRPHVAERIGAVPAVPGGPRA